MLLGGLACDWTLVRIGVLLTETLLKAYLDVGSVSCSQESLFSAYLVLGGSPCSREIFAFSLTTSLHCTRAFFQLTLLADFEHLEQVKVTKDGENMQRVDLKLKPPRVDDISLGLLSEDAQNFVCLVAGYYRIFVDPDKRLVERTLGKNTTDPDGELKTVASV